MSEALVVPTGVANVASMLAALARAGATPRLCADPSELARASHVVLPGVGAFAEGMAALTRLGLADALRERARAGRATLAVCLGMQLLCEASEESPGVPGLGVVPARVTRLAAERVPHIGWSPVAGGYAYFAHSYALPAPPAGTPVGCDVELATHGAPFVATLRRDGLLATQFHPELSGDYGHHVLEQWLDARSSTAAAPARVIPCLDVKDGRVVKGVRFANLRDAGSPEELAARYADQGADEIVVLDVAATRENRATAADTVARVRARVAIPVTAGGGVRGLSDARRLLEAGADKVAINTAAVERPELVRELAGCFGRQCTVLAIDAASAEDGWRVRVRSGSDDSGRDAVDWAREGVAAGAGEILLTSFDRDGTRAGYDLALLAAVRAAVPVPIIASGGASDPEHLAAAVRHGAQAVLAASIFHDGVTTVHDVKRRLSGLGIFVRP